MFCCVVCCVLLLGVFISNCCIVCDNTIHAFLVPRVIIAAAPPLVAAVESDSIPLQVGAHKALGDRFYSAAIEILVLF